MDRGMVLGNLQHREHTWTLLALNLLSNSSFQVVHGLSVPLGKAGYHLPRTISSVISTSTANETEPVPLTDIQHTHSTATPQMDAPGSSRRARKRPEQRSSPRPPLFRIGRSVIRSRSPSRQLQPGMGQTDEPERPVNLVVHESSAGAK